MKFANIKKGEVLSSVMYMEVLNKSIDSVDVKDSFGRQFTIRGPKLIEEAMYSAYQFDTEEKVSRTKAAEILTSAGDTVFTVEFEKADGSVRLLVGRLLDTENLMGRSNVLDLMLPMGSNQRQVDHRTLKSIIIKNVKYTVKK